MNLNRYYCARGYTNDIPMGGRMRRVHRGYLSSGGQRNKGFVLDIIDVTNSLRSTYSILSTLFKAKPMLQSTSYLSIKRQLIGVFLPLQYKHGSPGIVGVSHPGFECRTIRIQGSNPVHVTLYYFISIYIPPRSRGQ